MRARRGCDGTGRRRCRWPAPARPSVAPLADPADRDRAGDRRRGTPAGRVSSDDAPALRSVLPDATARVEIGSVTAAALSDPLARALYAYVVADVTVPDDDVAGYHARNPMRFAAGTRTDRGWRNPGRRRPCSRFVRRSRPICWLRRADAPSGTGSTCAAPIWSNWRPGTSIPATPAAR